jgi:DNA mismatch repair protein MutL
VILAEAPDGSLYLVDQHRAHERIIYEYLRQTYVGRQAVQEDQHEQEPQDEELLGTSESHLLLEPVVVELKPREADLLELRLPMLRGMGLECERFGGRSFLIRSVPVGVSLGLAQGEQGEQADQRAQLASHLPELARLAAEDSSEWQDRLLIGLSCRSALRRGRPLGSDEQRSLLQLLANVSAPAVCPHGSPIVLHYSRKFLIDRFDW